ncbi:Xin actin-binding repeat-containing protein [Actinidia chinensis var. chinensis]|uniref:Xin actin-binding repeat-containing protein n=1 Tax=Actinidia chinensis var. chinensis TaxID=1590841 RepID=A0A2R6QAJ8_ACTCC|nr:Xin actin-binding repeat-containing protein [Actinidia chinensis var. chinensis]
MPLWKKAKCTRISKLVADHLQPPKHGGSLVVETGFPTSLVDLFVKNRGCLKKPNSNSKNKKKRLEPIPDLIPTPSTSPSILDSKSELGLPSVCVLASERGSEIVEIEEKKKRLDPVPDLIPTPSPSSSALDLNSELGLPSVCVSASERGSKSVEIEERGVVGEGEGCRCAVVEANANGVLVAILKMFLVVVLAMGTKKFVVGITISAFVLLLIDYAGKHLCRLLKPCADAQRFLVGRCLCFVGIKREKCSIIIEDDRRLKAPIAQEGAKPPVVSDCFGLIEDHKVGDCVQEIEIVQPKLNLAHSWLIEGHKMNDTIEEIQIEQPSHNLVPPTGEIQSARYEFDMHSGEEKWVREELGKKEEVTEKEEAYSSDAVGLKTQSTRSSKIRLKIKKLISSKLRGSKMRMGSKNESSSFTRDHEVVLDEAKKHLKDGELRGLEHGDKSLLLSSEGNGDQADVVDSICISSEPSLVEMEDSKVREDIGTKTAKNKVYLILIVIVLVGLVWGRGLALALALSWYLLLKWAETLQKFIKIPSTRSQ